MSNTLLRVSAVNYKNLDISDGVRFQRLNIFIGSNGSGKSNLIALLEYLQGAFIPMGPARGKETLWENAVKSHLQGTGMLNATLPYPNEVRLSFSVEDSSCSGAAYLDITAKIINDISFSLSSESFGVADIESGIGKYPLYKIIQDESGVRAEAVKTPAGKDYFNSCTIKPKNDINLDTACMLALEEDFRNLALSCFPDFVANWHFYKANHMNVRAIRSSEPKIGSIDDLWLDPSGENLASVLDNLCRTHLDFEERLQAAAKAILPQTRRVRAIRGGRLSLAIEWHFEGIKNPFYLDQLSDGTVRMLCWAAVLLSPEPPSLLVIDEPELGLHVEWMGILAEWIKEAATRTQVIVTTHSPDLLDQFTDHIPSVYRFQKKENGLFGVEPLSEERLRPWLQEGWQLGDLYRVGDPNVGGWSA